MEKYYYVLLMMNVLFFSDLDLLFSGDGEVDWAEFQVKFTNSRIFSFLVYFFINSINQIFFYLYVHIFKISAIKIFVSKLSDINHIFQGPKIRVKRIPLSTQDQFNYKDIKDELSSSNKDERLPRIVPLETMKRSIQPSDSYAYKFSRRLVDNLLPRRVSSMQIVEYSINKYFVSN